MQVYELNESSKAKRKQKAPRGRRKLPQRSPVLGSSDLRTEFEHAMLGPEKRRAMLE
jgi:hypothetical protein